MQKLQAIIEKLCIVILIFGGIALVATMLLVSADVLSRYLFSRPIPGTLEFVSSYLMVALIFLPIAYVQLRRQNIAVDLFTMKLGDRAKAGIDAAVGILAMLYIGLLTYLVFREAVHATQVGEFLDIYVAFMPIWPARWFLVLGFGAMFAVIVLQCIVDAIFAVTGRGVPTFRAQEDSLTIE